MDSHKVIGNAPWLTEDGIDLARFPIDAILAQSLESDEDSFRSAVILLRSMSAAGRTEAGIYLLGLLAASETDLERRAMIVEGLREVDTPACANVLFAELKRVKSSNTTRRYLKTVIDVLTSLRPELVRVGFEELANDTSFSYKMRNKFRAVSQELEFRDQHYC